MTYNRREYHDAEERHPPIEISPPSCVFVPRFVDLAQGLFEIASEFETTEPSLGVFGIGYWFGRKREEGGDEPRFSHITLVNFFLSHSTFSFLLKRNKMNLQKEMVGSNIPKGNTKPTANKTICAFLLLSALPSACSSMLGALNKLRRLPMLLLSCQRCGDQICEPLLRGTPQTSVSTLLSSACVIIKESRVGWWVLLVST